MKREVELIQVGSDEFSQLMDRTSKEFSSYHKCTLNKLEKKSEKNFLWIIVCRKKNSFNSQPADKGKLIKKKKKRLCQCHYKLSSNKGEKFIKRKSAVVQIISRISNSTSRSPFNQLN